MKSSKRRGSNVNTGKNDFKQNQRKNSNTNSSAVEPLSKNIKNSRSPKLPRKTPPPRPVRSTSQSKSSIGVGEVNLPANIIENPETTDNKKVPTPMPRTIFL